MPDAARLFLNPNFSTSDAIEFASSTINSLSSSVYLRLLLFPGLPVGAKFTLFDFETILTTFRNDIYCAEIIGRGWAVANALYQINNISQEYASPAAQAQAHIRKAASADIDESIGDGGTVFSMLMRRIAPIDPDDRTIDSEPALLRAAVLNPASSLPIADIVASIDAGIVHDWFHEQMMNLHPGTPPTDMTGNSYDSDAETAARDTYFQILYSLGFWSDETLSIVRVSSSLGALHLPPPPDAFALTEDGHRDYKRFLFYKSGFTSWAYHDSCFLAIVDTPVKDHYELK